jgi:DNA repair protein RadC
MAMDRLMASALAPTGFTSFRGVPIRDRYDAIDLLAKTFSGLPFERLIVLGLNRQLRVVGQYTVDGDRSQVQIDINAMLREMLVLGSVSVVLAHNHPSGDCAASEADRRVTQWILQSCKLLKLTCLDHIIFAGGRYYSFREHGLL